MTSYKGLLSIYWTWMALKTYQNQMPIMSILYSASPPH